MLKETRDVLLSILEDAPKPLTVYAWANLANKSRVTVHRAIPVFKSEGYLKITRGPHGLLYAYKAPNLETIQVQQTTQLMASASSLSRYDYLEFLNVSSDGPVIGLALRTQNLPIAIFRLMQEALVSREGGSVNTETLTGVRQALNDTLESYNMAAGIVARLLSTKELWDPAKLPAFLSYEISDETLLNKKERARLNSERVIEGLNALRTQTPQVASEGSQE